MKLNILMVRKQNLINLNWKPTQMVVELKNKIIYNWLLIVRKNVVPNFIEFEKSNNKKSIVILFE
jgi:hypothetical protein